MKITPEGTVKVLDFGLAKAAAGDGSAPDLSQSPTVTVGGTREGIILGTAAYMSPEQARGQPVDKRTDIWAFGCVLYEMLTGGVAFPGATITDTLAAILEREPNWSALPPATPASIHRLLRHCLDKHPKQRFRDIGDVRIDLEDALGEPAATPARGKRPAWTASLAVGTVLIVALAIPATRYLRQTPPLSPPEMRTEIVTPATTDPVSFALSPDGRQLVFVASGDGPSRLWLRPLTATSAQPLVGTDRAQFPFWSPDSRSIGFFADGKLKRLDVGSGQPQVISDAFARGGTWNADGIVLFTRTSTSPLFRMSASGGEAVTVTELDRQNSHRFPLFLPDGRHFLFYAQGERDTAGIYLGSLDAADMTRLTAADAAGVYMPPGWLAWVRGGTLVAQRLELTRGALAGDLVTLADPVAVDTLSLVGAVSVSATGLVAYRSGAANRRQLTWFDRSGKALSTLGAPDENNLTSPRLSPDGRRVAIYRTLQGNADIWLLEGGRTSRFTFDDGLDRYPLWSPDGSRIAFDSNRTSARNLYAKRSGGGGSEELLLDSPQDKAANDWSADGRFLIYHSIDPQTNRDLWVLPLEADRKPWVFLKTPFNERWAQFSLDGRWVAYVSNESGRDEIYVRPFVRAAASTSTDDAVGGRAAGQWQVSTAGGNFPRWRADGKELYYIGLDGQLMAAPLASAGATLEPGAPVALFHTDIFGGGTDNGQSWQYDVARDGRFLINTVLDDASSPITLLP